MKGGSQSTTTKEDITNVTTTTTTTVGDIGLTGQQAVDAISTLEAGVIAREEIGAKLIQSVSADISRGYNNLGAVTQDVLKNFSTSSEKSVANAKESAEGDKTKFMYITGAALAVVALLALKK